MDNLAGDPHRDIVLFINDFYPEFAAAVNKLSRRLGRPLRGIMLIDEGQNAKGQVLRDTEKVFDEIICDFLDEAALQKILKPLEKQLLIVSCESEDGQLFFQRIIPHVPYVATPTETSIHWATHKGKMREAIGSYNPSLVPKSRVICKVDETEIVDILSNLSFPLIVKPTALDSSKLVQKVADEQELRDVLQRTFLLLPDVYKRDRALSKPGLIVEEFIVGDLYQTDAYVDATGTVSVLPMVSGKPAFAAGLPGFYIYQTDTYTGLSEADIRAGDLAVEQAVHGIALRSSVAHIELFHTSSGWKIIEIAARPGALRQEIYSASYGIDHAYNELLTKIGLAPEMPASRRHHNITFKIYAPHTGTLQEIEGLKEAAGHPSVYQVNAHAKPGDAILPSNHGGESLAEVVVHHTDHDQLLKDTEEIRSRIRVVTKNAT